MKITKTKSYKAAFTCIAAAVLYLGTEVLNGLFAHDNISQMAHIIGGVCGCAFVWLICNKKA